MHGWLKNPVGVRWKQRTPAGANKAGLVWLGTVSLGGVVFGQVSQGLAGKVWRVVEGLASRGKLWFCRQG